jgi:predicted 2-oxoglutarate/Fe(II)-dependent dioxygenase YbiX
MYCTQYYPQILSYAATCVARVSASYTGEMFIAKYEFAEGKQTSLKPHVDGTPWSFVIVLNDPGADFDGGGTRFIDDGVTYRPANVGSAIAFSGKNMHEGVAITRGIRYILTGFCTYTDKSDQTHEAFMQCYDAR